MENLERAYEFLKKAFADKKIVKGIICHGAWLMAPIAECVKGRKMVVHNNLIGDAKLMGIDYVDEDIVVDGDLVTARTGGEHVAFAQRIISLLNCGEILNFLNNRIDILESKIKQLEQKNFSVARQLNNTTNGGNTMAKVLIIATNYGSWAEELQAPWDACKKAGFEVTLATPKGQKPLPFKISVDPNFVDPVQKVKTNPEWVCNRCKELVDGEEWAHPKKFTEVNMDDYDAIVLTGGPGANLDMANSWELHQLIMRAYKTGKIVAALCYAVSTLVFLRDPENDYKSIIYGKKITAHPRAWDFYGPGMAMVYEVYGGEKDLATDVVTPGFQWPIEDLVRDAVGPNGACIARINTTRENPQVYYDHPFITGTSVESSIAYGDKIVEVLKKLGK